MCKEGVFEQRRADFTRGLLQQRNADGDQFLLGNARSRGRTIDSAGDAPILVEHRHGDGDDDGAALGDAHRAALLAIERVRDLERLDRILDQADRLGMVVILGYFYFGQRAKVPLGSLRRSVVFKKSSPDAGGCAQLPKMPSAR